MSGSRNSRKGTRKGKAIRADRETAIQKDKKAVRAERRGFVVHASNTTTVDAYGPRNRYLWENLP